jgi:type VI secretion system protein ImpH
MADDARQPGADLSAPAAAMDAQALLRALERDGRRFGAAGRPEREPARLGQVARLAFAAADVAAFRPADGASPARVALHSIGLMGPEGPLPLHLTRWVLDRLSQRWHAAGGEGVIADTTFADFADLLQHRMLALHYRAWADARPEVQGERPDDGRIGALVSALAGLGLPGVDDPHAAARRRHAAPLAHQVEGPERTTQVLADALGVPVTLVEFRPNWLELPPPLQTRLGRRHAALGHSAALGPRSFQRQTGIELRLGPLTRPQFDALLPDAPRLAALRRSARHLVGTGLRADLRLVLRRDHVPAAQLGSALLGRTAWLGPRHHGDADDLVLPALLDRPARAA